MHHILYGAFDTFLRPCGAKRSDRACSALTPQLTPKTQIDLLNDVLVFHIIYYMLYNIYYLSYNYSTCAVAVSDFSSLNGSLLL